MLYRNDAGVGESQLGRWLGDSRVSHRVGQLMSYWILPKSGIPISCVTVQQLTNLEKETDIWKQRMSQFDTFINERLTVKNSALPKFDDIDLTDYRLSTEADKEFIEEYSKVISSEDMKDSDDSETNNAPSYLGMEFGMPRDSHEHLQFAKVMKEVTDDEGVPIGKANNNPILDSRMFEVEYLDGTTEVLAANVIAENIVSQVDDNAHRQLLIDEIVDHRKDDSALSWDQATITSNTGVKKMKKTTRGWELFV